MKNVPLKIFSIWFGSMFSEKNERNFDMLWTLNPQYEIILYSDSSTMSSRQYKKITTFCKQRKNIQLIDIQSCHYEYIDLVKDELNCAKNENDAPLKKIRYARASDLTRMTALYHHGGIYCELDLIPKKGFGQLTTSTGLLTVIYDEIFEKDIESGNLKGLKYYDLIVAIPKQSVFSQALKLHKNDQEVLHSLKSNPLLAVSSTRHGLKAFVIATTGSIFDYSMTEYQISYGDEITKNHDILPAYRYVERENSNSWLPPNVGQITEEEALFAAWLFQQIHNKRKENNLQLSEVQVEELLEDTISSFPTRHPAEEIIFPFTENSEKLRLSDYGNLPAHRLTAKEMQVDIDAIDGSDLMHFPPLFPLPSSLETRYTQGSQVKIPELAFEPPVIVLPNERLYAHRHRFGMFSPLNILRNLVNNTPWNATTRQREDLIASRNLTN